jgi:hypothetical protein
MPARRLTANRIGCLIAIHHWGWTLRLNSDGTTTATSPDGHRIWHSHSPPTQAA